MSSEERSLLVVVVVISTFSLFGGCSPFGGRAAPGKDAGTSDGSSGSTSSSTSSSGSSSSSSSGDGGGAIGDDASANRWCATQTLPAGAVCLDFDDGSKPIEAGWGSIDTSLGKVTREKGEATSDPFAMVVDVPKNPSGNFARISRTLPSLASMKLEFDFRPEVRGPAGDDAVAHIAQLVQGNWYVELYAREGLTMIQEYNNNQGRQGYVDLPELPLNQWHRVTLEVVNDIGGVKFKVNVPGYLSGTIDTHLTKASTTQIHLGITDVNGSSNAWRQRYDNVVLVVQ